MTGAWIEKVAATKTSHAMATVGLSMKMVNAAAFCVRPSVIGWLICSSERVVAADDPLS
jgi:hypothetical protein